MKKLLALVLMICMAAACLPAFADGESYVYTPVPYVLDLSKGPCEVQCSLDDYEDGSLCESFDMTRSIAYICKKIVMVDNGTVYDVDSDVIVDIYPYSIDGDTTPDFKYSCGDNATTCYSRIEALPTASCGPVVTLSVGPPANWGWWVEVMDYDFTYFDPLTIIFDSSVSDKTGSYELGADGATFVKPAKAAASVKVPDSITVGGTVFPVTKIADNAFKGQKKLTKVTIGKNIQEIGKGAFQNCAKLKTVSGGANLEVIGDLAFSGCKALTKFTIGAKVNKIGKKAFFKCAALKKVTIKSKLLTKSTVGNAAFKGIYQTATIKVPKAVKKEYTKWLLKKGIKKTMKIK